MGRVSKCKGKERFVYVKRAACATRVASIVKAQEAGLQYLSKKKRVEMLDAVDGKRLNENSRTQKTGYVGGR